MNDNKPKFELALPDISVSVNNSEVLSVTGVHLELTDGARNYEHLPERIATWLNYDVANGDATVDTIKSYLNHFKQWVEWAHFNAVHPMYATEDDIKKYRMFLQVNCEAKPSTIKARLSVMRRFFAAMHKRGFIPLNPVADVKAPRDRRIKNNFKHLSEGEAENLFNAIKDNDSLKSLRDEAILHLMMLEGLRRVEIMRLSDIDLAEMEGPKSRILIHGKGKDRYIFPRDETIEAIKKYIRKRGPIEPDEMGMPLFCSVDKGMNTRGRISRVGLNKVVDSYLVGSGAKRAGISCHALRHTCGYLIQKQFHDPKIVQEVLGHENLETASIYAHVEEGSKARYTSKLRLRTKRGTEPETEAGNE